MPDRPRALITGITGQDGSYLAELLLSKGYEVYGIVRRTSAFNRGRISSIYPYPRPQPGLELIYGDLADSSSINKILRNVRPREVYHLGAQSHVRVSFDIPEYTGDVTGLGTVRLLEGLREIEPKAKFYQASSSELFGNAAECPQKETTPFRPANPYGCAKLYAYAITVNYREAYRLFAVNGILFNHESPRRGEAFVTRKITRAAARIKLGLQDKLFLGNLEAKRDWGYAPDYVDAMWLMLQQDRPEDYVIATGEVHSVREFAELAFAEVGLDWKEHVEIDPKYFRPLELNVLQGDASKAAKRLGWTPKVRYEELVRIMVQSDLQEVKKEISGGAA